MKILNEAQGFQCPIVHIWFSGHIGSITQQISIFLKHDPHARCRPKLGEESLPIMLHQLHRRLAGNRFLSGESKEKRSSRSEEHTSELQSRVDLVCRLLLE